MPYGMGRVGWGMAASFVVAWVTWNVCPPHIFLRHAPTHLAPTRLELVAALLTALEDEAGEATSQLLQLDLLPLMTSVLAAWVDKLRQEDAEFGGGPQPSAASAVVEPPAASLSAGSEVASPAVGEGQQEGETQGPPPAPAIPRVAAEVTAAVLAETLNLLNLVATAEPGCGALSDSHETRHTLVRLLSASEDEQVQLAGVTILASIDNSDGDLLASCSALSTVLAVLAAAPSSAAIGDEEAEAAWSLVSRVVRLLAAPGQQEMPAVLDTLSARIDVLTAEGWAASPAATQHQRFVLRVLRGLQGSTSPAWVRAVHAIADWLARHGL